MSKQLWEVLVPVAYNDGRNINHETFEAWLRIKHGGLTKCPPVDGQWVNPDGKLYAERMIPYRVLVQDARDMERIADVVAGMYDQHAVMYYHIAEYPVVQEYTHYNARPSVAACLEVAATK